MELIYECCFIPWNIAIQLFNFDAYTIVECDPWQKDHILMLDVHSLSEFPKVTLNFLRNASKSLNKGDWCSNKGENQTKVVFNNKMSMSPTWAKPIGYWWRWSQITKCICLIKIWNFEHVPLNLLSRLICGSFGWDCVVETHPRKVKTSLVYKWVTHFWSVWFSYSRFLRTTMTSSIDVNMILKQKDRNNKIIKMGLMGICLSHAQK